MVNYYHVFAPLVFNLNAMQFKTQKWAVRTDTATEEALSFSLKEQEREILILRKGVEITQPPHP